MLINKQVIHKSNVNRLSKLEPKDVDQTEIFVDPDKI